jgi:hypothetical protein
MKYVKIKILYVSAGKLIIAPIFADLMKKKLIIKI